MLWIAGTLFCFALGWWMRQIERKLDRITALLEAAQPPR